MPGLIDTVTGLRYGSGLIFEPGLGSDGLNNPEQQIDSGELFAGVGSLRASAMIFKFGSAAFAGSGALVGSTVASLPIRATLGGQGLLSAAGYDLNDIYFQGSGSFSVDTLPLNSYVAENGTTYYVAENGTTYYVKEN